MKVSKVQKLSKSNSKLNKNYKSNLVKNLRKNKKYYIGLMISLLALLLIKKYHYIKVKVPLLVVKKYLTNLYYNKNKLYNALIRKIATNKLKQNLKI